MPARKHPIPEPPAFEGTDINDVPEEALGFPAGGTRDDAPPTEGGSEDATYRAAVDAEYAEIADDAAQNPPKLEEPVPEPRALTVVRPDSSDHHVVVGMATLANMSEEEFEAKIAVLKKGQERVERLQTELMKEGVDYGKVKGIAKPFLHQPGAERLNNFYGLAISQEVTRVTRQVGDSPEVPPFAFHVKTLVHLGDTDGPVITEAFGEANPYEEKYRYRWTKRVCPNCGRDDALIVRKTPEAMKGKTQCAAFGDKKGCGSVFEPGDPRLVPNSKEVVADADLWGLAETILQMSSKRSMVAGTRRATGTSGLFTQDEDSPSVQRQSAETAPEGDEPQREPVVETVAMSISNPVPGGVPSKVQFDRLKALAGEKGLKGKDIAELLNRLFGMAVELNAAAAGAAVQTLNADQLGNLLAFIEVGDTSSIGRAEPNGAMTAAEVEAADPVAYASYPDDIGAK